MTHQPGPHPREREDRYTLPVYRKIPLTVLRTDGVWVYGDDNRRYLDFYGGLAVALVGHGHPRVVAALHRQLDRLLYYSNAAYVPERGLAAEAIARFTGEHFPRTFFVNSGAEAAEVAGKIAHRATGRTVFVALKGGWHGRTTGALTVTGVASARQPFEGMLGTCRFVECGDIDGLDHAITDEVAAFYAEPIMSMGGMFHADAAFYRHAAARCHEVGAYYISDEIQCGWGRTGRDFGFEHYEMMPDMLLAAKGLAGGVPVGAVLCSEAVAQTVNFGDQGTTFGGGPLACAAIREVLGIIRDEDLVENARTLGDYLQRELPTISGIEGVTGRGLLLGVQTTRPTTDWVPALREEGILVTGSSDPQRLRLFPPLIINQDHCDMLLEACAKVGAELR